MSTRRRLLAVGGLLVVAAGGLLVDAWRPAPHRTFRADIRDSRGSGLAAAIELTQPAWLRPGRAGDVILEVTRLASDSPSTSTPKALVARLTGQGAEVSPGEEQAASWTAAGPWSFTWRVEASDALDPGAALSLSLRDYAQSVPAETILWAWLVHFEVRPPLLAPGASLVVLAGALSLTVYALGRPE